MEIPKELKNFFGSDNRLKVWPAKPAAKQLVCALLAEKFEFSKEYSEKEVNEILKDNNSFGDHQLLRRELFERGFLVRLPNGSIYWRKPNG